MDRKKFKVGCKVRFGYAGSSYRKNKGWSESKIMSCCGNKWFTVAGPLIVLPNNKIKFKTIEFGNVFEFNFNVFKL